MLEGRLYRPDEIAQALRGKDSELDPYLHPLMREIRRSRDAILFIWERAQRGPEEVSLENLKAIHRILTPRSRDRGGLYRKTSPVHRDYYQRICSAEKVPYHLRKLFEQIHQEYDEASDPVDFTASIHHRLMFIYPFRRNPGLATRLFTNLLLLSRGYPPAIIPATSRPAYYSALKHPEPERLAQLYREAVSCFLSSSGLRLLRS